MAGIVVSDVEVHRTEIAALFSGFGEGGRWLKALSYEMKLLAAAEAPKRSGSLARSHYISFRRGSNAYQAVAEVQNRSEHAEYVHFGTSRQHGTRVLPPGGPGVPTVSPYAGQRFGKIVARKGVAGQNANPWLERTCSQVARSYGAVQVL